MVTNMDGFIGNWLYSIPSHSSAEEWAFYDFPAEHSVPQEVEVIKPFGREE
jgi:hypothetical protein